MVRMELARRTLSEKVEDSLQSFALYAWLSIELGKTRELLAREFETANESESYAQCMAILSSMGALCVEGKEDAGIRAMKIYDEISTSTEKIVTFLARAERNDFRPVSKSLGKPLAVESMRATGNDTPYKPVSSRESAIPLVLSVCTNPEKKRTLTSQGTLGKRCRPDSLEVLGQEEKEIASDVAFPKQTRKASQ